MKALISILIFLTLVSCQQNNKDSATYLVKYGNREVHTAEFINKMMTLGFVKYGKTLFKLNNNKYNFD